MNYFYKCKFEVVLESALSSTVLMKLITASLLRTVGGV